MAGLLLVQGAARPQGMAPPPNQMLGLTRLPHIAAPARPLRTAQMSGGDQQGAALPWAAAELQGEKAEPDWPAKLGLSLGSRVEVQWSIHKEQEGGEEVSLTKWWGASLDSKPEGETDGEGRQVYVLKYDPDIDNGFEEHEMRAVTFLDDHVLYDNVEGEDASDLLHWRREGEDWEPPAAEEGPDGEAAPLSLGDIVQQISAAERLRGRTVEEETADALAELPAEKRLRIASGFRDFSERLAAELSRLTEQHGAGYVVTEADMKAATAAAMAAALGGGR